MSSKIPDSHQLKKFLESRYGEILLKTQGGYGECSFRCELIFEGKKYHGISSGSGASQFEALLLIAEKLGHVCWSTEPITK